MMPQGRLPFLKGRRKGILDEIGLQRCLVLVQKHTKFSAAMNKTT